MYTGLLHAHNGFRWLVLLALVVSVVLAISGWLGKREWKKTDNLFNLILVIFTDLQFLVGLVLYAFVSPITKAAFQNFGAAMKNPDLRFYAVEHILLMVVALVLIHIGRSKSKKASSSVKKHRTAAIFYTLSLVLILAGIPWSRALF
ncbi:cytochrome B [Maribellus luteus]|uniref:Cytochrome B n=1 Tax=Maribellus luteus TaxID=2305463 RepID=A0A399SYF1_9BACT|nr:cytochrome B [Maribellus luteus]RIJ49140.1 cytochrome B [Maribellus luteus]